MFQRAFVTVEKPQIEVKFQYLMNLKKKKIKISLQETIKGIKNDHTL